MPELIPLLLPQDRIVHLLKVDHNRRVCREVLMQNWVDCGWESGYGAPGRQ